MATQPTNPPSLNNFPQAPNSITDSVSEFDVNANNFVAAQVSYVPEANALSTWYKSTAQITYSNALETASSATTATQQVALAKAQVDEAEIYANFAQQSANFWGDWSSLSGSLQRGGVVLYNSIRWQAMVDISNVAASTPSGTNSDWTIISDQNVVLTGGNYFIGNPSSLPEGHKVNFVNKIGVTSAVVKNSFSQFKTDAGNFDDIIVGSNKGFTATVVGGFWEV